MKNTQLQRSGNAAVKKTASGEKVKIRIKKTEVNEYFMEASERARGAKWVCFVVLIAFLLVNLIFFREHITYSNMLYLLRDLDTGTYAVSGEFAGAEYAEVTAASFELYKGKLAVSSNSGFTVYNSTGSTDVEENIYMKNPAVAAGEKYAVAYDMGGNTYSVYSTMGRVSGGTTENIIESCVVSDAGSFVILSRSNEAEFVATFYNTKLRAAMNYYRDAYVVAMAIDSKGESLAMASAAITNSGISTEIMLARTDSDATETVTVSNAMPLAMKYFGEKLLVFCDSKIAVFEGNQIVNEYSFASGSPVSFDFSDRGLAVVCSENAVGSSNACYVFDDSGTLKTTFKVNEKVESVALEETDCVYLLFDGRIEKREGENRTTSRTDGEILDMVPYYGKLIVCTRTSARITEFN